LRCPLDMIIRALKKLIYPDSVDCRKNGLPSAGGAILLGA
jgi:hypothetical protein